MRKEENIGKQNKRESCWKCKAKKVKCHEIREAKHRNEDKIDNEERKYKENKRKENRVHKRENGRRKFINTIKYKQQKERIGKERERKSKRWRQDEG